MARIRSIKPEFPQSESMGRVSRDARLCFVNLWTICDDVGRARGSSRMLASLLFPYDDDAPKLIGKWLDELERERCVIRYEIDGTHYIQIAKWLDHQKIDHPTPSRLPAPLESSRNLAKYSEALAPDLGPRTKDHNLGEDQESVCTEPSAAVPEASPPSPAFIALETNVEGKQFIVTEAQAAEFRELYPAVNIDQEMRTIKAWLWTNRGKRKTHNGMMRFINSWLSKEQNKGHSDGHGNRNNGKSLSSPDAHLQGLADLVGIVEGESEGVYRRGTVTGLSVVTRR